MAQPLTGVIDLDRGNSAPLARQLYEQLRSAIADGRLQQGYRLPSSRMLAGQLDVSRNTVSAAIDQLAAEGYLDIARGRRPSIAAGLVRLPAVDAVRGQPVAPARQRLSGWARRIGQSNWPPSDTKAPLARSSRDWPMGGRFRTTSGRDACAEPRAAPTRDEAADPTVSPCRRPWPDTSSSTAASGRSRARSLSHPRRRRPSS